MWLIWVLPFLVTVNSQSDVSPCPRFFVYEGKSPEPNRWYGIITLLSDTDLNSVWLYILFDRPTLQLGNWFAEPLPQTDDNREYLIQNEYYKLKAYTRLPLRFYIDYNPLEPKPRLVSFRLNGQVLCPEKFKEQTTTSAPKLYVSRLNGNESTSSEEETFPGDFALIIRHRETVIDNSECGLITDGKFPWHADLYHGTDGNKQYLCGGSLVSRNFVVTAAQCVVRNNALIPPTEISTHMGENFDEVQQVRSVAVIQLHPSYNPATLRNNIALLKLSAKVDITKFVCTVGLSTNNAALTEGIVQSWSLSTFSNKLKQSTMTIVPNKKCVHSNPNFYSRFTSGTTFCAEYHNSTSVCNESLGTGMVLKSGGQWLLRGIVSSAVPLSNSTCDALQYGVFTDVSKYLGWIRGSIANEGGSND